MSPAPLSGFDPPLAAVRPVVSAALAEDLLPMGDITASLVPARVEATAVFVARQRGVLAGTLCVEETFAQLAGPPLGPSSSGAVSAGPSVHLDWTCGDGARLEPGCVIGTVTGPLALILTAERTALNLLSHLSGVASATRLLVDAVEAAAPRCRIRDTRKTTPGLRALEKAAVRAGGGFNHRANLSEAILVKDNHLGGLSITEAVATARAHWPGRHVEVECDRFDQLDEALAAGADMVMLDNMDPVQVADAVEHVRSRSASTPVEVSGRINLETAAAYARAGVDFISVGAITHSAPVLDIGLDLAG
ncbi:MAG TPA: carboxylating nicotinate-nucleotide diphosphorylase [Acidimicrobiales bacterium]|nr:carboxylating nicotinate-nucleotide diphosphorylase [Acidimicrobiales bacterium]